VRLDAEQVAVVTGSGSGIGLGLARAFAERGLRVVLADIRADGLAAAAQAMPDPDRIATVVADVADPAAVDRLRDETLTRFGRVDVVCNNAGIVVPENPLWQQSIEAWDRMLRIKLMGAVNGIRSFAPVLLAQESGHFLNTSSIRGLVPRSGLTPYVAAMSGVVGLTVTLDEELRAVSAGVGATVLCPGMVHTDLLRNSAELVPGSVTEMAQTPPGAAMAPAEVAALAIRAIEDDRVMVVPNADRVDEVDSHFARLLGDIRSVHAGTE